MRTTIDLPDELLRRAKATAALRGMKLKDLVAGCLEAGLSQGSISEASGIRPKRSSPPLIPEAMTGKRIPALSKDEMNAIDEEEDLEKLGRSFGR